MAYDRKVQVARWIVELGLPLTINVVLHRGNIDETTAIIAFAERLGAQRLELANTQYLGWALLNRQALLPSLEQIQQARALVEAARLRLLGKIEILFVTADYYGGFPRACMDGWGRRYLVVAPDGRVLPCHAAHTIPGLPAAQASATSLREIWEESELFNIFRGESWMPAPCNSCDRRRVDYGGCRCQAFHLTGHASNTDPVCRWAPEHGQIQAARAAAEETKTSFPLSYRTLKMVP
jgi:pyrroloquinoline quinone biosynthesis protein E